MADLIVLKGMEFYGYHGVRSEERAMGQRFVVDLELETDLSRAAATDSLEYTIDYSQVFALVRELLEGPPVGLLETLASRIATAVLDRWSLVEGVRARVKKPCVSIAGAHLEYAGVEVYRTRSAEH